MGQRVEVSLEDARFLTQRPRVLERRGSTVVLEMPDAIEDVSKRELGRLLRRSRWLLGQRWRPEDD